MLAPLVVADAVPDIAVDTIWEPLLLRLAFAVAANVVGALTVPVAVDAVCRAPTTEASPI